MIWVARYVPQSPWNVWSFCSSRLHIEKPLSRFDMGISRLHRIKSWILDGMTGLYPYKSAVQQLLFIWQASASSKAVCHDLVVWKDMLSINCALLSHWLAKLVALGLGKCAVHTMGSVVSLQSGNLRNSIECILGSAFAGDLWSNCSQFKHFVLEYFRDGDHPKTTVCPRLP